MAFRMYSADRHTEKRSLSRWIAYLVFIFAAAAISAYPLTIETSGGYIFDFLVTRTWDFDIRLSQPVAEKLSLTGTLQYIDATQDPLSGIRRLSAKSFSGFGGFGWVTLFDHVAVDIAAGADVITDVPVKPRFELKLSSAIPLPANPIVSRSRLVSTSWYRHHSTNAAVLKNRIASYGFDADLTAGLLSRFDFGLNLRRELLSPENMLLDTALMYDVRGGIPFDTLKDNSITSFFVYTTGKVLNHLSAGYCFSWSHSAINRRLATRREPAMDTVYYAFNLPPIEQLKGTAFQYANYPYSTPRHSLAHLLVISSAVPLGLKVLWEGKASIPLYSRSEIFSEPDTVPLGELYEAWNYRFRQTHLGPLSIQTKLLARMSDRLMVKLLLEYFCLPYEQWTYFTRNSYSYTKITTGIDVEF